MLYLLYRDDNGIGIFANPPYNGGSVTKVTKAIKFFFIHAVRRGYLLLNCVLKYRIP